MKKSAYRLYLLGCMLTGLFFLSTCSKLEKTMLVTTGEVSNFTATTAEISGQVVDLGDGVTEHGHCYFTSPNVSVNNFKTQLGTPAGTGGFTSQLAGLQPGTKYYVKAYMSNGSETVYGKEISFNTTQSTNGVPVLTTAEVTGHTTNSAISGGTIVDDGGSAITGKGVCWGTSANPTVNNPKTDNGTGTAAFVSNITGLDASTTYHVRAYAINSSGPGYGNEVTFTTSASAANKPTVSTTAVTAVTATTASSGGDITDDGGASVTARGVCWSTSLNPTINDPKTIDGSGKGVFNSVIEGLNPSTTYHVRAYATNSAGTSYGNDLSFTTSTSSVSKPAVSTTAVTAVTATSASSGGDITDDGGASVTARGVCWSNSLNPTIDDPKTTDGSGKGVFNSVIEGLNPSTTYHVRAYATNSAGTSYGNDLSFITSNEVITIVPPTNLSADAESVSQIRLAWNDNSDNEEGFKIERSPNGDGDWMEIATVVNNITDFVDTDLVPATMYYYRVRAFREANFSDFSNIAVASTPSELAILRIVNNTHYDMIDIHLNGTQHVVTPGTGILVGNDFGAEFNSSGPVSYVLGVGFWDGPARNVWFTLTGEVNVTIGEETPLVFHNPTIGQMLSGFMESQDWLGYYYDSFSNYHFAGYNFTQAGEWTFYDDFVATASGSVILVSWPDYATSITFKTCPSCGNIQLTYPFGSFLYANGPSSWPTIEYVRQAGAK